MNIKYIHLNTCKYFQKYMLYVCLYIYIINIHSTHSYILCKQKLLFWMRLITINHLTALIFNQVKLLKSDSKDIYNVTKDLYFK